MVETIKPLGDRVLVEPAPAEERTTSGIIIPDTAKEKPQRGRVIAAGQGKKDEPTSTHPYLSTSPLKKEDLLVPFSQIISARLANCMSLIASIPPSPEMIFFVSLL